MALIAFDIYGTVINTQGVLTHLENILHNKTLAAQFSSTWRDKQLEYSFRRGLMQRYQNFAVCTEQALAYCDACYQTGLSAADKQALLTAYKTLPAFNDVINCLTMLKEDKHLCVAFSNGTTEAVSALLQQAGIANYFEQIISVDSLKTFKPNPQVYQYLAAQTNTPLSEIYLVSGNTFDVLGALAVGMKGIWLQRDNAAVFDAWEYSYDHKIASLLELKQAIVQAT